MQTAVLPIFLFLVCAIALAVGLPLVTGLFNRGQPGPVKRMPYESGMDPIHDTRRRFDVRFYLLAIAFLVFDVELLFLFPWAVASWPAREGAVGGGESEVTRAESGGRRAESEGASRDSSLLARHSPPLGGREEMGTGTSPRADLSRFTGPGSEPVPISSQPLTPPEGIDAAVAGGLVENRHLVFAGAMTFVTLLVVGFVYDWRKGVFQWK